MRSIFDLLNVFRRRRLYDDISEEIRTHLAERVELLTASGMDPKEAEERARREFGNVTLIEEKSRAAWGWTWLERIAQDVRYALRSLRRSPTFAVAAVASLALGIGANSAVFTVVNAVLLRPLPYRDADRLVTFWETSREMGFSGLSAVCDPDFVEWRRQKQLFSEVAAFRGKTSNFTGAGIPERLIGSEVSPSLFPLLGLSPILGRGFVEDDLRGGRGGVVVLSHAFWVRRFNSSSSVLGQAITLDEQAFTVIGVMPEEFDFPNRAAFWTPLVLSGDCSNSFDQMLARLGPGVTLDRARVEVPDFASRLDRERGRPGNRAIAPMPLRDVIASRMAPTLLLLSGAVGLVLIIACANVANLLLARTAARRQELGMRRALGATTLRLATQLLTESVCLGVLGGLVGVGLVYVLRKPLIALVPESTTPGSFSLPLGGPLLDWRVVGFTFCVAFAAGLFFGLAPALSTAGSHLVYGLKGSAARLGGKSRSYGLRGILVASEVALTMVLLLAAGLLLKSLIQLNNISHGFEPQRLLTQNLELPDTRYPDSAARIRFHDSVLDRVLALPGVSAAGTIGFGLPYGGSGIRGDFSVEGQAPLPGNIMVAKLVVSPGYFRAMQIPLVHGRSFEAIDDSHAPPVAVISESVERRFWPAGGAIGARIDVFGAPLCTVVGVAGNVKEMGLTAAPEMAVYLPYAQSPRPFLQSFMTIVVRTDGDPMRVSNSIRKAVQSVDSEMPVFDVASMEQLVAKSKSEPRLNTAVVTSFGVLAILLATVGIYGVVAYSVAQRSSEIGIRIALGAQYGEVLRMMVLQGLRVTVCGLAVGMLATLAAGKALASHLYQVKADDPAAIAAVVALLLASSLIASYAAARRAVRIDPVTALRAE
ncbi:MAG: ABC transporter permease [Acidobacteria bacterium]|nr:MAG: ABC transporter permease [Acidobacteriota bacterium]